MIFFLYLENIKSNISKSNPLKRAASVKQESLGKLYKKKKKLIEKNDELVYWCYICDALTLFIMVYFLIFEWVFNVVLFMEKSKILRRKKTTFILILFIFWKIVCRSGLNFLKNCESFSLSFLKVLIFHLSFSSGHHV